MPRDFDVVSVAPDASSSDAYLLSIVGRPSSTVRLRMEVLVVAGRPARVRSLDSIGSAPRGEVSGPAGSRVWVDLPGHGGTLRMLTPSEEKLVGQLVVLQTQEFAPPAPSGVEAREMTPMAAAAQWCFI